MKRRYEKAGKCAVYCSPFEINKAPRKASETVLTVFIPKNYSHNCFQFCVQFGKIRRSRGKWFTESHEFVVFLKSTRLVQVN